MKTIFFSLSVLGLIASTSAYTQEIELSPQDAKGWMSTGMKDSQGQDLYALPVVVKKLDENTAEVHSIDVETHKELSVSIVLGAELNTMQIGAVSVGMIIGYPVGNAEGGIGLFKSVSGVMAQADFGLSGNTYALGMGTFDVSPHGLAGGVFAGIALYQPNGSYGAFLGRKGQNYVGTEVEAMLIAAKATFGVFAKAGDAGVGGADVIVKLGIGLGL